MPWDHPKRPLWDHLLGIPPAPVLLTACIAAFLSVGSGRRRCVQGGPCVLGPRSAQTLAGQRGLALNRAAIASRPQDRVLPAILDDNLSAGLSVDRLVCLRGDA